MFVSFGVYALVDYVWLFALEVCVGVLVLEATQFGLL